MMGETDRTVVTKTVPDATEIPPTPVPVEPGWIPVNPFPTLGARSFVSGHPNDGRLRVAYFRRVRDGALVGRVWFGPNAEGPPGHAHGGSLAAVLDEAMGGAAWMSGHTVLAAKISVDFRMMVPLGTDAVIEAWVETVDGRKVEARGRLCDPNGEVLVEGYGLYVMVLSDRLEELRQQAQSQLAR